MIGGVVLFKYNLHRLIVVNGYGLILGETGSQESDKRAGIEVAADRHSRTGG